MPSTELSRREKVKKSLKDAPKPVRAQATEILRPFSNLSPANFQALLGSSELGLSLANTREIQEEAAAGVESIGSSMGFREDRFGNQVMVTETLKIAPLNAPYLLREQTGLLRVVPYQGTRSKGDPHYESIVFATKYQLPAGEATTSDSFTKCLVRDGLTQVSFPFFGLKLKYTLVDNELALTRVSYIVPPQDDDFLALVENMQADERRNEKITRLRYKIEDKIADVRREMQRTDIDIYKREQLQLRIDTLHRRLDELPDRPVLLIPSWHDLEKWDSEMHDGFSMHDIEVTPEGHALDVDDFVITDIRTSNDNPADSEADENQLTISFLSTDTGQERVTLSVPHIVYQREK